MKRENLCPKGFERNRPPDSRYAARFRAAAERNNLHESVENRADYRNLQKTFVETKNSRLKSINRPQNDDCRRHQIKERNNRLMHRAVGNRRKNDSRAEQEEDNFTR